MSKIKASKELKMLDKKFKNSDAILGKALMTIPNRINSSRTIMYANQLDQYEVLEEPEVAAVFTNYESMAGEFSTGFLKAESNYEVIDRINKFEFEGEDVKDISYLLVVYDNDKKEYDVIQKKEYEKLTEAYGYAYNTKGMDNKDKGDTIEKGEVLYASTSYDDYMNYRYGINARTMYVIDTDTTEDAIKISQSFADKLASNKYEVVRIPINDNDIFINLYGKNDYYKSFPDLGEKVKDKTLAVIRRINYSQLLYDLKADSLNKINHLSDTPLYGKGRVIDINIYCNKNIEEIDDSPYNAQILKYYRNELRYHEEVVKKLGYLKKLGKCGSELNFLYKRSLDIINENVVWKDVANNNTPFSNMIIEFVIKKRSSVKIGSKLSGRFGDKGVISAIIPDELMPRIEETGEYVEVCKNELGTYNRLNPAQKNNEVEINFITAKVRGLMRATNDYEKKAYLFLSIIKDFNKEQYVSIKSKLKMLTEEQRNSMLDQIQETRINIHQPPFWNNASIDDFERIYDKWGFDKYELTIKKFGRQVKMMNKMVVGEQYFMKLKHTGENKFSVRSTAQVNPKDLPYKSNSAKTNKSLYSNTPVVMAA